MNNFTPAELTRLMDYFAQELEPEELVLTERWMDEQVDRRAFVEDLRRSRIDLALDPSVAAWNLPARVDTLSQSLSSVWSDDPISSKPSLQQSAPQPQGVSVPGASGYKHRQAWWHLPRSAWYTVGTVAASALLVISGWYMGTRSQSVPVAMYTYTTGQGERATIALPDGSYILLNVASKIQVPTNYSSDNRTIQLSGEALFTVIPLPGEPFTVVSGSSTTRVLGTSFTVRHYDSDTAATVAVRDGKVSIGSVVLTADQAAIVAGTGIPKVFPAESRQFSFSNGVLQFNDTPFLNTIAELNRWYNVDIRLGDPSLKDLRILGTFEAGSITDLVSILEFTFNLRVVRDGRTLTLYGER